MSFVGSLAFGIDFEMCRIGMHEDSSVSEGEARSAAPSHDSCVPISATEKGSPEA
jgi:hypothetical protein